MDDDDLIELKALFLDECLENIELLEQGLMRMGDGEGDLDTLNDVFRAAHSIKGGAATFGYVPMSELTHYMETLLDEMRSGRRPVEDTDVELLLRALDLVQGILQGSRESDASDHPERAALQTSLQASVERGAGVSSAATDDADERDGAAVDVGSSDSSEEAELDPDAAADALPWRVRFEPARELMRRGNEPLLLLRELARLGECNARRRSFGPCPPGEDYDPRCLLPRVGRDAGGRRRRGGHHRGLRVGGGRVHAERLARGWATRPRSLLRTRRPLRRALRPMRFRRCRLPGSTLVALLDGGTR